MAGGKGEAKKDRQIFRNGLKLIYVCFIVLNIFVVSNRAIMCNPETSGYRLVVYLVPIAIAIALMSAPLTILGIVVFLLFYSAMIC